MGVRGRCGPRARGARGDDGASAVEFALVLPILIVLVFGIIEFGLAFNAQITLTHAAREGARLAAVNQYSASAVQAKAYPLTGVSATSQLKTDATLGDYYEVTVSVPYQLVIPLWKGVSFTMSSTATMRKE